MKFKLILLALTLSTPLLAQEAGEHAAKAAREAKAAVVAGAKEAKSAVVAGAEKAKGAVLKAGDKAAAAVQASGEAAEKAIGGGSEALSQVEPFQAMKESIPKHLHNKIVHFAVALGLFGGLFLLLSFRYPSYKWPARVLLFCAGVAAAFALPTGEAQAAAFDGTSLHEVLEWHEKAGKVALGLIWGAFLLSFFDVTRKFFWLYAIVLFWFILTAGALGGILATS